MMTISSLFTRFLYKKPKNSCPAPKNSVSSKTQVRKRIYNIKPMTNPIEEPKEVDSRNDIRPKRFVDVIGQEEVKEYLKIKITAFKKNLGTKSEMPVGHILFLGFSGSGKTTMANVMANEMQVGFHQVMATRIKSWNDFYQIIKNIQANDVIFIDEIHALAPKIQEQLYGVMEDFICTLEDKNLQKPITVRLPRFTLIGATTHTGSLNSPLLSRFQYKGQLLPYNHQQLKEMVISAGHRIYNVTVPQDIAERIAKLSRSTARTCYNLLRSYMDVVEASTQDKPTSDKLTEDLLRKTLKLEQIDPIIGLDYASRKYIVTILRDREPIGSRSIASMINEQESTVQDMIEPFLLSDISLEYKVSGESRKEVGPFAKITKKGRVATQNAYTYLKLCISLQQQGWFQNETLNL